MIKSKKVKATVLIICSAFFFTLMNICVRMAGDLPSTQKSFFRNLVAAVVAFVIVLREHKGIHIGKGNIPFLLMRSVFGTVGILCNYYAVDNLVLSNATMLNKMSPFFVLIFSFIILKEKLKPYQIAAVITAFAGSLLVIKPTFQNVELVPSLIGLLGGLGAGAAYTMVRILGIRGERGSIIVLFFSVFSCVSVAPYVILKGEPMSAKQLALLFGAGIFAAIAQFCITGAYSNAPAKEISVYDYSQVIFAAVLGFFIFGDVPDALSFGGYALIIGAAVMMFILTNRHSDSLEGE